jgi:hypothetical protein
MTEPPYGIIAGELAKGKVIPFLGAAASTGIRPANARFNATNPNYMPSAKELAEVLAMEARFPSRDPVDRGDLAKVSSYYVDVSGRTQLCSRLRELLNPNLAPSNDTATTPQMRPLALHRLLARVPKPQVVVTTNYDTLIEDAFDEIKKPYDVVVYPAERSAIGEAVLWIPFGKDPVERATNELDQDIDLGTTTVIFKMHGTTNRQREGFDHFVITEEDYVEFLSRMTTNSAIPSMFYPHFRNRSFLFLGYGLRDWNLRVLLKNLNRQLAMRQKSSQNETVGGVNSNRARTSADEVITALRSWAIQLRPSELERALWETRNVKIYNVSLDRFVTELEKEFQRTASRE